MVPGPCAHRGSPLPPGSVDHQDTSVDSRPRDEGVTRDARPERRPELPSPPSGARRLGPCPSPCDRILENEPRGHQPTAGLEQSVQQGGAHPERRVCHHVVRPRRQAKVCGVRLDDDDLPLEALPQRDRPPAMGLDGDHACAGPQQWCGDRARACADVEDDRSARDRRVSDELLGPCPFELVPAPWPLGHGGERSSRGSCREGESNHDRDTTDFRRIGHGGEGRE